MRKRKNFESFSFVPDFDSTKYEKFTVMRDDGGEAAMEMDFVTIDPDRLDMQIMPESTMTHSLCDDQVQAYNFISLNMAVLAETAEDLSGMHGDEADRAQVMIESIIMNGFYLPKEKMEDRGYVMTEGAKTLVSNDGTEYVNFNPYIASSSDLRSFGCVATDWPFKKFAEKTTSRGEYLYGETHDAFKALARFGLIKSSGIALPEFKFSHTVIPDLIVKRNVNAIHYDAGKSLDSQDLTTPTDREIDINVNDGCGFITPDKAKELADLLGLDKTPSGYQVRLGGGVKGMLFVAPFREYTENKIDKDIVFTQSMYKADFDIHESTFVVTGYSHGEKPRDTWNIQMITSLERQLGENFILPHVEKVYHAMQAAKESPEGAMEFLKMIDEVRPSIVMDIADEENPIVNAETGKWAPSSDPEAEAERRDNRTVAMNLLEANPDDSFKLSWVKSVILTEMKDTIERMKGGNIIMENTTTAYIAPDWVDIINNLHLAENPNERFAGFNFGGIGKPVVPVEKQTPGLSAGQCLFHGKNGLGGDIVLCRTPLTHEAEIVKQANVAGSEEMAKQLQLYRHQKDIIILNNIDPSAAKMGGADFDGDKVKAVTNPEVVSKFNQTAMINTLSASTKLEKTKLTEDTAKKVILTHMKKNKLDEVMVAAASNREIVNDFQNGGEMLKNLIRAVSVTGSANHPLHPFAKEIIDSKKNLDGNSSLTVDQRKKMLDVTLNNICKTKIIPILEKDAVFYKGQSGIVIDAPKTGETPDFKEYVMKCSPLYRTSGQSLKQQVEKQKEHGAPNASIINRDKKMYCYTSIRTGTLKTTQMPKSSENLLKQAEKWLAQQGKVGKGTYYVFKWKN